MPRRTLIVLKWFVLILKHSLLAFCLFYLIFRDSLDTQICEEHNPGQTRDDKHRKAAQDTAERIRRSIIPIYFTNPFNSKMTKQEQDDDERRHQDMLKLIRHQNRTNFILAALALLAFLVTGYQAYISRDTEHRQLRAYVNIVNSPGAELSYAHETNTFSVAIPVKNTGQTPAYRLVIHSTMTYESASGMSTVDPLAPHVIPSPPIVLGPNESFGRNISMQLAERDGKAVDDGSRVVWIVVRIDYEDAFGIDRFSECRFVQGAQNPSGTYALLIADNQRDN